MRLLWSFIWETARVVAKTFLPAWLVGEGDRTTHGGSRWARPSEWAKLGQLARPERLAPDGIVLGWLGRQVLQSPREDNVLLLGVQRSGKTTTVVVPTLLGWSGAAVATSTKEELVRLTAHQRTTRGSVWVFAPLDRDHSWLARLGLGPASWNPVADALTCADAAELADLFTADGKRGPSAHWYLSAANLLTGLIVVTRERGGDMRSVLALLNRTAQQEYFEQASITEDQTASDLLFAFAQTPEKEAGSIASTARSCLSLWIDERVAMATGSTGDELDLDRLLEEGGTLYMVAPAEEAERCRPLFSALLSTLLRKATTRARAEGGVLAPRLLLALDEAANFARIPRLAGYTSSGPGQGIQLLLCYHDLAQIEAAYGPDGARTIWNNCRARLLLPGQGDLKTLDHFSRAIGDETRIYQSIQQDRNRTGHSEQRTGRALMTVDELRRLTSPLLVYSNSPPALLEMRRWDEVPAWRVLVEPPERST
jgi:type IV secretory pathway TraG/TraD family ATPase VirD4